MLTPKSIAEQPQDRSLPILTIYIPTYNRSQFVARLLNSIALELVNFSALVEVLVSDDCSDDNTQEIVASFTNRGLPIYSIRQPSNLGMDANFRFGFLNAKTEYVWIFGDDDVLLKGALTILIPQLQRQRISFAFIGGYAFSGEFNQHRTFFHNLGPSRLTDSKDLINTANYLLTFITRGIINKRAVIEANPDAKFEQYMGLIISQLAFVFGALKTNLPCLIIAEDMIAAQLDNSGGYSFFKTFGPNFFHIVNCEYPDDPKPWQIIGNSLLEAHFPSHLYWHRSRDKFHRESSIDVLMPIFKKNYRFLLYCYPIIVLPKKLAYYYCWFIRGILKIKRIIRSGWWSVRYSHRVIKIEK